MSLQNLILKLHQFWAGQGCYLAPTYDVEVGAGTMTPDTFFRVLDKKPWRVAYVQPSRRPTDGRYGENPHRVQKHFQYQVIIKPSPADIQQIYVQSLVSLGINLAEHDLRFDEDDWESPTIGAWGVGWQVVLDGLEITQFTYFQQAGGIELFPVPAEITYGLERLEMFLEGKDNLYDLSWSDDTTYSELRMRECGMIVLHMVICILKKKKNFPSIISAKPMWGGCRNSTPWLAKKPLCSSTKTSSCQPTICASSVPISSTCSIREEP